MKIKNIMQCFFLGMFTPCWLLAEEVSIEITPTPMMFNAKELQEGKNLVNKMLHQEEQAVSSVILAETAEALTESDAVELQAKSDRELFEIEYIADGYQTISKYWKNAAKPFNEGDQESAELWIKAAEQMQKYINDLQVTAKEHVLKKIPMGSYTTVDSSLRCAAEHLADAAGYSEQLFQAKDSLETATFFRIAKEQSEAASERAKESFQAHQLENKEKGNELGSSVRISGRRARYQDQSLHEVMPVSEELEKLAQAFEFQENNDSKASRVLSKIAYCLANVSEYLTQATHAREAGNLESATLWEKAAQQSEVAGEQWKRVIHESIVLETQKLEYFEKNVSSDQEASHNKSVKEQLKQKEHIAFWQKVAEQAGTSLDHDQLKVMLGASPTPFRFFSPSVVRTPQITHFEKVANFLTGSADHLADAAQCFKKAIDATTVEQLGALWQDSAKQFENAAEYYAQSAQEYLLDSRLKDGRQSAEVGDSFKESAQCLSQVIKYRDQASLAQTEGRLELASCWTQAAEKSQIAAEYYKKHAQLSMAEDFEKNERFGRRYTELNENKVVADNYQKISQYWHHVAEAFNASDEESAKLWMRAAEQMQVYIDCRQATVEKNALVKMPCSDYCTADGSLQCAAQHLAAAAGYSEQVFQTQNSLEAAALFRKAKEQSEAASERAKESAQAYQLENRNEGSDLGIVANTLWKSAQSFATAALCHSTEAKQSMINAAEQWNKSSEAYKMGNIEEEGYCLESSAKYFKVRANQLEEALKYTQKASQYQTPWQSELATLLTQAAESAKIAAEYRSKGAQAYALGNEEEGKRWSEKAQPIEEIINYNLIRRGRGEIVPILPPVQGSSEQLSNETTKERPEKSRS
ncbi:MAG TPA: hypothetical protein VJK54_07095 [Chthoniobacterales bacterium]|nr:hypothetical protein [Chthoniobacterales bacterium]